ncbi:hypothetical protein K7G95_14000 [Escherichia coli]|nr:hypothetical protein K7G95_14000 [Escherichia coli]
MGGYQVLSQKPARNGSHVQILGDNIYHQNENNEWIQEDSHHSNADGSFNMTNLERDTSSNNVLISDHFIILVIKRLK